MNITHKTKTKTKGFKSRLPRIQNNKKLDQPLTTRKTKEEPKRRNNNARSRNPKPQRAPSVCFRRARIRRPPPPRRHPRRGPWSCCTARRIRTSPPGARVTESPSHRVTESPNASMVLVWERSLHYTPEHCLGTGGFPLFWRKTIASNDCNMYLLRSPVWEVGFLLMQQVAIIRPPASPGLLVYIYIYMLRPLPL